MSKKTVIVKGIKSYTSLFALTVTLKPKMFSLDPVIQRDRLQGILNQMCDDESIKISAVVELTKSNNIHAHGFVQVAMPVGTKTVEYIVCNKFRKEKDIGFILVKPITDHQIWHDYTLKDMQVTMNNLREPAIICDHCEVYDWFDRYLKPDIKQMFRETSKNVCLNEEHWAQGGNDIMKCPCQRCGSFNVDTTQGGAPCDPE